MELATAKLAEQPAEADVNKLETSKFPADQGIHGPAQENQAGYTRDLPEQEGDSPGQAGDHCWGGRPLQSAAGVQQGLCDHTELGCVICDKV